jgi:hypothetical protein
MPDPVAAAAGPPAAPTLITVHAPHHFSFRDLLSELNPLQYLPVVGTLYRAITGDRIPEAAREAGSLIFSGLTGGPVGIAVNLATEVVEKVTGIDPEKIGTRALASLGVGRTPDKPPAPIIEAHAPPPRPALVQQAAWSAAQLAAYGVTTTSQGILRHGNEEGSDVLNGLELARLHARATTA